MSIWLLLILAVSFLILVTFSRLPRALIWFKKKRIARKQYELARIQIRILEVETSIVLMTADVQRMDRATDYATEHWQARRAKRYVAVESDRTLLCRLEEREKLLKRNLGIT